MTAGADRRRRLRGSCFAARVAREPHGAAAPAAVHVVDLARRRRARRDRLVLRERHSARCTSSRARCSAATSSSTRQAPRTQGDRLAARLAARRDGVPSATATNFASMALVPRTGGTRLVQVHAVAPAYPFYGNDHHRAGRRVGAACRAGTTSSSIRRCSCRSTAQIGDTRVARHREVRRHRNAQERAGRRRHLGGDRAARLHPRALRRRDAARRLRQPRRVRDAVQAAGRSMSRESVRRAVRPAAVSRAPGRQHARRRLQRVAPRRARSTSCTTISRSSGSSRCCSAASASRAACTRSRCGRSIRWRFCAASAPRAGRCSRSTRCRRRSWDSSAPRRASCSASAFSSCSRACCSDFLPVDVDVRLAPSAMLLGLGIGVWVALLFALRPLVALRRVSPLQALRREPDADALDARALRSAAHHAVARDRGERARARPEPREHVPARHRLHARRSPARSAFCISSASLLSWAARRALRPSWPFPLRQGIASLYRPGNQTRAVVLALGFGVFLMGTLYQVQSNILRSLGVRLDQARANVVFFDVQDGQRAGHRLDRSRQPHTR